MNPEAGLRDVIDELDHLIALQPERADLHAARASVLVRLGNLNDALAELTRVKELDAKNLPARVQLALLRLQSGDVAGYRTERNALLEAVQHLDRVSITHETAQIALLESLDSPQFEIAQTLAANAVRWEYPDGTLLNRQLTRSLVEYRLGRFDGAIEWSRKTLSTAGSKSIPGWTHARQSAAFVGANAILAMANHKMGNHAGAAEALRMAVQTATTNVPFAVGVDPGREWSAALVAHQLLKEAQTMLGAAKSNPPEAERRIGH